MKIINLIGDALVIFLALVSFVGTIILNGVYKIGVGNGLISFVLTANIFCSLFTLFLWVGRMIQDEKNNQKKK